MDIKEELEALEASAETAQRKRAQAEAVVEAAKERLKDTVNVLKTEYGVSTVAEAEALLASLEEELQAKLIETRRLLDQA